jgi:hypothetical protein
MAGVRCVLAVHGRMSQRPNYHFLKSEEYDGLDRWEATEQWKPVYEGKDQVDEVRWLRITRHVAYMIVANAREQVGKLEAKALWLERQARGTANSVKNERDPKVRADAQARLDGYQRDLALVREKLAEYERTAETGGEEVTEWPFAECV